MRFGVSRTSTRSTIGPTTVVAGLVPTMLVAAFVAALWPAESAVRGSLVEALEYGTPPHGGIALGLDRIVAILANESSIREVIAFPKTASATSLMDGSPSAVEAETWKELGLKGAEAK